MNEIDQRRSVVLQSVRQHELTLEQAGRALSLSPRQVIRIWKRFREEGERGLSHRNQGRPSNRAYSGELKQEVLEEYREHGQGLGPTRFALHLAQRGIRINHETLRRWLTESGLWELNRTVRAPQPVNRRARGFGEIVAFVSMPFGRPGSGLPPAVILGAYDEATSVTLWSLAPEESCTAAMRLLWLWIDRYGIPAAIRCHSRSLLLERRPLTLEEQLAGGDERTPFARSCDRLGIDAGGMGSTWARAVLNVVRPMVGFLEDGLRDLAAPTLAEANGMLRGMLGGALNARFAAPAATDCHVPIIDGTDLVDVFRLTPEAGSPCRS